MKKISQKQSGFTLIEIMIATSIAMVLLFGALYSTSETLSVVREGDVIVQTNVHARRSLDRMLKDFRYSSNIKIDGSANEGWEIKIKTTGTLDPEEVTYSWDPVDKELLVRSEDEEDVVLTDLRVFNLVKESKEINGATAITRVKVEWVMGLDAGELAGKVPMPEERTFEVAGATWIRRNDI